MPALSPESLSQRRLVQVPDVVGMPLKKALLLLTQAGLHIEDVVYSESYEERDVVEEERRMRIESEPLGRLSELLIETAFAAHPYHQPAIGYMSDLEAITRTDATLPRSRPPC